MADIMSLDPASRAYERAAVPRWVMRSMLLGACLYLLGALGMWLWQYSNRPEVLLSFFPPPLAISAVILWGACATLRPSSWVNRLVLLLLAVVPIAWLIGAIHDLVVVWPAGWKWITAAAFRLLFLGWLGAEVAIGALSLLRADRQVLALAAEHRVGPNLLGAPQALSELAHGRWSVLWRFVLATLFFSLAALQSVGLLVIPDLTWQRAVEICKGEPVAANASCFSQMGNAELIGQIIVWPVAFAIFIAIGRWLERSAQRRTRDSAAEIMSRDETSAPILFLRSFRNDQVELAPPSASPLGWLFGLSRPTRFLDHLLVEEFAVYGPTVALGRPGQKTPPFGVWRSYLHESGRGEGEPEWQRQIAELAGRAQAIVMVADYEKDTDGVAWELQHIVSRHLAKTLLIAPPAFKEKAANTALWSAVARLTGSAALAAPHGTEPLLAIFLAKGSKPSLATSRSFVATDYLMALRWFFRSRFPDAR